MASMRKTRKRNGRRKTPDTEALAASLPNHLRTFGTYADPNDYRSHATAVADWLDTQAPGQADKLAMPVMMAAGLSPADWFRLALAQKAPTPYAVPTSPPAEPDYPVPDLRNCVWDIDRDESEPPPHTPRPRTHQVWGRETPEEQRREREVIRFIKQVSAQSMKRTK